MAETTLLERPQQQSLHGIAPGLTALERRLHADFQARLANPTSQPVGIPLTRKQLLDWDEKSRAAWSGLQS